MQNKCFLESVHNRLNETHRYWHSMLDGYQDVEIFRTNLNAAIQALRNVTFMLQSSKSKINNFDKIYEKYREIMKKDPVLVWLHDSRNTIVKKEDLMVKSQAVISLQTWLNFPLFVVDVSPLTKTEDVGLDFLKLSVLPKVLRDRTILNLERKWIDVKLPKWELLESLAYCFKHIKKIVDDIHSICNINIRTCKENLHKDINCMVVTKQDRSVDIDTEDLRIIKVRSKNLNLTKEMVEKVSNRYKDLLVNIPETNPIYHDPFEDLIFINNMAKRVLIKDRNHSCILFLYKKSGPPNILQIQPKKHTDKYVMIKGVAEEIIKNKYFGVVLISETWYLDLNKRGTDEISEEEIEEIVVSKHPKRREALTVSAISANKLKIAETKFRRTFFGKIVFGKTEIKEPPIEEFRILIPLREALLKVG